MSYSKQSANDDEHFRIAAKAIIALRNEKLAGIARNLQFDPGGLSGWLGGTPNRLSFEKKEILSCYLGLEYAHISTQVVHYWPTCTDDLIAFMPSLLNQKMLKSISVNMITSDTIPIGCVYHSKIGESTFIALCKAQNKAFPIPIISPEEAGWGNLLPPIEITRHVWNTWWSDQNTSPEEIAGYLFRSSE